MDCNIHQFISRRSTLFSHLWHFWETFSSLLPFTKYLPFVHRPKSCTTVWQQLNVLGSRRVVSLSIRIQSNVHNSLCIMLSVFVDSGGHKRGQTSRPVVGAKVQTNCNFKAHLLHGSNLLGAAWCRWFMLHFRLPNRYVVWPYNYTILPNNLSRLVHKDFLRSQSSLGSSRTTTTEPTKSTKHFAIQKGSV